ncbi:uncharacterized protein LOC132637471 [Lycium barbarum]|uniref:uncharacterized protein LOC132637471 n=1 Tax=Lycium barbarum TaxID=112863 RepID=UPI00293E2AD3|nr:uncharacterized protein LOC132637471 [Lycium barbarum]
MINQPTPQVTNWPWKHIWKTKIPCKVACFSWLLAKEAVLTHENLKKRNWTMCSRCFLCEKEVETIGHLFLHCRITDQLWKIFINLRGIAWTMPRKITEALFSWEAAGAGANDINRWKMVPACIWWAIWKERNSRCFENSSNTMQEIKLNCIKLFSFWCNQIYPEDTISILDSLGSC